VVTQFLRKWTIQPSLPEIPVTMETPPPPTAPGRQFSVSIAALPKRVTSLHHCVRSDGGLEVEKYLQRQAIAHEWSLWRTSMALNLIHGVGESLSAGGKALKKSGHQDVFMDAKNLRIRNCR
jgi:hypothetical protein